MSSQVVDLANRIIELDMVPQAQAAIAILRKRRTIDPATGEITTPATDVATPAGQLPESVLDAFRQYFGGDSLHQWGIGRVVDDALIEFAGKISANKIIRAAAKEMDLSRSQILKCQLTWHATDDSLRSEFDQLRFEHFAAVARHLDDRDAMHRWLSLAVESADDYGGRFMPAAKLEAKIKAALGIGPVEPTPGELLERAVRAVQNYQAVAEGRGHERATKALAELEKVNQP